MSGLGGREAVDEQLAMPYCLEPKSKEMLSHHDKKLRLAPSFFLASRILASSVLVSSVWGRKLYTRSDASGDGYDVLTRHLRCGDEGF